MAPSRRDPVTPHEVCNLTDTIAQPRAGLANAWIEEDELAITGGDGYRSPGYVLQSGVGHLTHIIRDVTHIYVEHTDDGGTAALLVESADGTRTIIQLRATPLRGQPGAVVVDPPGSEHDASG